MTLSQKKHTYLILVILLITAAITACSDIDKAEISQVMDARDRAISHQSIPEYSALISTDYNDNNRGKINVVAQMVSLFDKFERAEMSSYDRQIRQLDESRAQCDQSYTLKVFADGEWRRIVQREQLTLTRNSTGWKIISGL
ncbi:MAG: hypothetical protein ABUK11_01380 [Mariprofundaceae bacterium]